MTMEVGYVQLVGVVVGAAAAVGGGVLAHVFTRSREARSRQLEGLREVHSALSQQARIALELTRYINLRLHTKTIQEATIDAINSSEFGALVLAVHERRWRFACLAFLPEALDEFEDVDRLMGSFMDPYEWEDGGVKHYASAEEFRKRTAAIEAKLIARLRKTL